MDRTVHEEPGCPSGVPGGSRVARPAHRAAAGESGGGDDGPRGCRGTTSATTRDADAMPGEDGGMQGARCVRLWAALTHE